MATPALLAQVLIAGYCDDTPLYRQSQSLPGMASILGVRRWPDWVGGACWWLEALHDRLCKNVFASDHLFADDTPVPVLDPGRGRRKTARLWVYAREQRPWSGPEPPAAVFLFAPDRKAERPASHLARFKGVLHVDGYAGFERLAATGDVVLAACWAHTRRKFYEVAEATGSPVAAEHCAGSANSMPSRRGARAVPRPPLAERRSFSTPIVEALRVWLEAQLSRISGRSPLAEAIRYALSRWDGLTRFLHDGRIELDTNPVERAIRPVALGRKNHLCRQRRRRRTLGDRLHLGRTAKLNGLEPYAYLVDVLQRMVDGHPVNRLDELLPWTWKSGKTRQALINVSPPDAFHRDRSPETGACGARPCGSAGLFMG